MSGKSLALEVAFLELLLNGTAMANVWDDAASSPITVVYLSLHTDDPGKTGNQATNEITYGSYARVAVARTTGGWTIDPLTGIATPNAAIVFPTPTSVSGSVIATYACVGRDASGAGFQFWSGAISPPIVITVGVAPQLTNLSQIAET